MQQLNRHKENIQSDCMNRPLLSQPENSPEMLSGEESLPGRQFTGFNSLACCLFMQLCWALQKNALDILHSSPGGDPFAESWLQFGHCIYIKAYYKDLQGHRKCFPKHSLENLQPVKVHILHKLYTCTVKVKSGKWKIIDTPPLRPSPIPTDWVTYRSLGRPALPE